MKYLILIALSILRFIYFIIKKIYKQENIITFISRQQNSITVDFELLKKEIEKDGKYKVVVLTKKLDPGIKNKISYMFHMFKQMKYMAKSKCIVLDSYCIVACCLKHKKNLVILQMWHAMGSSKKFGYSVLDTDPTTSAFKSMNKNKKLMLADVMCMHKGYDKVFTSCNISLPYFAEAFNCSKDKMVVMPLPVVDLLLDDNYKKEITDKVWNEIPSMKEKENIVFVPTFRPEEKEENIQDLIDCIDYDKYNLIIKLHPLTKLSKYDDRVIWDNKFSSKDMMIASDYIITDYSAIVYEASLLDKPIFFYTYDLEDYINTRDFYIDFKSEMPGTLNKEPINIIKDIENKTYSLDRIREFRNKYIELPNKKVCSAIYDLIEDEINKKTIH